MSVPRLQHYLVAFALLHQGATLDQCEGGCQERATSPSLMQKLSMHDPSFAIAEEDVLPEVHDLSFANAEQKILPEMAIEAQAKAQLQAELEAAGQSSAQVRTAAPQHATPKEKGDENFDGNNHADEDDIKEEEQQAEQEEKEEEDEEQKKKGSDENDNANNDEEKVTQNSNNDEEADAETSPVDDGEQIMIGDKVRNRGKSNHADHRTPVLMSKSINNEENFNSQNYHNENENNLDDHNAGSNNAADVDNSDYNVAESQANEVLGGHLSPGQDAELRLNVEASNVETSDEENSNMAPVRQKPVNKAVQKIKKAMDKWSFDVDNHLAQS